MAQIDPGLPLQDVRTEQEQIGESMRTERALATLIVGFGLRPGCSLWRRCATNKAEIGSRRLEDRKGNTFGSCQFSSARIERLVIKLQGSAWAAGNAEIGRNWGYFGLGDHSGMIGDKPLPLTNQG